MKKVIETAKDRVKNLREFVLADNWEKQKRRIYEAHGLLPDIFRSVRGPVTLVMSLYGVENLIYLMIDDSGTAEEFRDIISDAIFQMAQITGEETGYPILKRIFDNWIPDDGDERYQHSDSEMGHLLSILSRLNLAGCNFGPTLTVRQIRGHMPNTRIDGQLCTVYVYEQ